MGEEATSLEASLEALSGVVGGLVSVVEAHRQRCEYTADEFEKLKGCLGNCKPRTNVVTRGQETEDPALRLKCFQDCAKDISAAPAARDARKKQRT